MKMIQKVQKQLLLVVIESQDSQSLSKKFHNTIHYSLFIDHLGHLVHRVQW